MSVGVQERTPHDVAGRIVFAKLLKCIRAAQVVVYNVGVPGAININSRGILTFGHAPLPIPCGVPVCVKLLNKSVLSIASGSIGVADNKRITR